MKTIKVGPVEIRGDMKATKKELEKHFARFLTTEQLEELNLKLNGVPKAKPAVKKVRKQKGTKK